MFEFNDRLIYSSENTLTQVERFTQDMSRPLEDPDLQKLFSRQERKNMEEDLRLLLQHAHEKLNVVIAGDFKRGKSTLINAILGESVLPTDVIPETITINHIVYGEEKQAEAVLKNGMRLRLFENEITRDKLEGIMENVPAPIDYLEIRRDLPILRELNFIDTPGLGDASGDYRETVAGILTRADIIVYVVSALAPMSMEEETFLNAVVMPQGLSKMFIVINMADALDSKEDMDRVKQRISARTLAFNPNASVHILSALDTLCRATGDNRPNPALAEALEQNCQLFLDALGNDVVLQKSFIKAERINAMEQRIAKGFTARLAAMAEMISADSRELDETERRLLEEKINMETILSETSQYVSSCVADKKQETRVWLDAFLDRLRLELEQMRNQAMGSELQKHLHFYLSDKLKEAFALCLDTHSRELSKELEEKLGAMQDQVFQTEGAYAGVSIHLKDISWTKVDTAFFFTEKLGLTNGLLELPVSAVFGFLRQHAVNKSSKNMLDPLLDDYVSVRKQAFDQIDDIYSSFAEDARQKVEEFYRRSIEQSLSGVQNARAVKAEFEGRKAETLDIIARFRQQIQAVDAQWQE